jgi:hypothetical protein
LNLDHRVNFISFFFIFFFVLDLSSLIVFFFFFPFYFFPLLIIFCLVATSSSFCALCYLKLLPHRVVAYLTITSSPCPMLRQPATLSCCFDLLSPCRTTSSLFHDIVSSLFRALLHCVTLSLPCALFCYFVMLPHYPTLLPRHITSLPHFITSCLLVLPSLISSLACFTTSLPQGTFWPPHLLFYCLEALCLATSLFHCFVLVGISLLLSILQEGAWSLEKQTFYEPLKKVNIFF